MSDLAISVEHVSKMYTIGPRAHGSLREVLDHNLKRLLYVRPDHTGGDRDTIWALKDVSFEIKVGEFVSIIGRNGSGKSTLLKILTRITAPTKGQVRIYGQIASLLEVGTGFSQELTGRENIYL